MLAYTFSQKVSFIHAAVLICLKKIIKKKMKIYQA